MKYPKERKEAILKKKLPPYHKSIAEIAKEEGICEATVYNWRQAPCAEDRLLPDGDSTPAGWTARQTNLRRSWRWPPLFHSATIGIWTRTLL